MKFGNSFCRENIRKEYNILSKTSFCRACWHACCNHTCAGRARHQVQNGWPEWAGHPGAPKVTKMANKTLFASAIARLLPAADAFNREAAPAYAYGPEALLAQLAATGTLSDNFYGSADVQLSQVVEAARAVSPYFAAQAAVYARRSGAMKDMPALLAAWLTV